MRAAEARSFTAFASEVLEVGLLDPDENTSITTPGRTRSAGTDAITTDSPTPGVSELAPPGIRQLLADAALIWLVTPPLTREWTIAHEVPSLCSFRIA